MLIKIGDFAKQAGVTIKTLRHYDKLGLLKPAWINRYNGYRYYAPKQLTITGMILAYKDMGFSLGQIANLLSEGLENHELCKLLEKHIKKLEEQIRKDQIQVAKVKTCLEKIVDGGGRTELEDMLASPQPLTLPYQQEIKMKVEIKHFAAFNIVGIQYLGKNEHSEIAMTWTAFNPRMDEIRHITGKTAYGICNIPDGLPEGDFEYICGLAVDQPGEIPNGMIARHLEEMQVAVFEHRGSFESLGETYSTIYQKWLPEAGLEPLKKGFDLEVYDEDFKDFAPDSIMYVYVPIKA